VEAVIHRDLPLQRAEASFAAWRDGDTAHQRRIAPNYDDLFARQGLSDQAGEVSLGLMD